MADINKAAGRGAHPSVNVGLERADFANLTAQNKRYEELAGEFDSYQKALTMTAEKSSLKRLEQEMKATKKGTAERKKAEQAYIREKQRVEKKALDVALAMTQNNYKRASVLEKAEIKKRQAESLKAERQILNKKRDMDLAAAAGNKKRQEKIIKENQKAVIQNVEQEAAARKTANDLTRSQQFSDLKNIRDKLKTFKEDAKNGDFSLIGAVANTMGKGATAVLNSFAKDAEAREEASKAELEALQGDLKAMEEAGIDPSDPKYIAKQKEIAEMQSQVLAEGWERAGANFAADFANSVKAAYEDVEDMMKDYKGIIEGRLQGSDKTYNSVMGKISGNLAMSPFISTKAVIDNMKRMAEEGYAYNIEQRSFLATISDKVASTFDAFDSNLTRLIKLQQADTTAARLGMEASLTKFFNNMFQDSSYLKNVSDSIAGAIIDANATMDRDSSAEFEYIVQKWLGSLSSLGMDTGALTQIAQGITYMATGDVTNLANNSSLQTLFAMSASNAGLSYSDILLNGLDASTTNKLLEAMVLYLKDIAENSDNQVVRSAYGDIFNLSMSDMKAISNLSRADISNIAKNTLSYSDMMTEVSNQLSFKTQMSRTSIGGMLSTLYENAVFGMAEDVVNNPVMYPMMKMIEFMESKKLDINIPFINAFGTGLDLNTSVRSLMNMGLGIGQAMSLAGNIVSGLGSKGGLDLGAWGGQDYTSRGSGLSFSTAGLAGGTSGSTSYVASGNSSDIKNSTISSATDDAEETEKITNKNNPDVYTVDDLYKAVIEGHEPYIQVQDSSLLSSFESSVGAIKTISTGPGSVQLENIELYVRQMKQLLDNVKKENAIRIVSESILKVELSEAPEVKVSTDSIKNALILAGLASTNTGDKSMYDILSEMHETGVKVDTNSTVKTELNNVSSAAVLQLVDLI